MKISLFCNLAFAIIVCGAIAAQAQENSETEALLGKVEAFYSQGAGKSIAVTPQDLHGAISGLIKNAGKDKTLLIVESKRKEKGDKYRCTMMRVLATVNDEIAARGLAHNLEDKSPAVRRCAAAMAGEQKSSVTIPGLLSAMSDDDREVRANSARSLGIMKVGKAVGALKKGVSDPEQMVSITSIWSLGEIGDKSSDTILIRRFASADEVAKSNILAALWKIKSEKSVAELKRVVSSESEPESVRALAKEYLGSSGK